MDALIAFQVGEKMVVPDLIAKGRSIELRLDCIQAASCPPGEPVKPRNDVSLPPLPQPLGNIARFRKLKSGKAVGRVKTLWNSCHINAILHCLFSLLDSSARCRRARDY
jgi:hypothetical protein